MWETEVDLKHLCMPGNVFLYLFYFTHVHYLHGYCRHLSLRACISFIYYRKVQIPVSLTVVNLWYKHYYLGKYHFSPCSVDSHVDINIKDVWEDQAQESVCSDH